MGVVLLNTFRSDYNIARRISQTHHGAKVDPKKDSKSNLYIRRKKESELGDNMGSKAGSRNGGKYDLHMAAKRVPKGKFSL